MNEDARQNGVLEDVGETAGVEGMAIVDLNCSLSGCGEVIHLRRRWPGGHCLALLGIAWFFLVLLGFIRANREFQWVTKEKIKQPLSFLLADGRRETDIRSVETISTIFLIYAINCVDFFLFAFRPGDSHPIPSQRTGATAIDPRWQLCRATLRQIA